MPNKTFYARNTAMWDIASQFAEMRDMSLSALIETAVDEYLARNMRHSHVAVFMVDALVRAGYSYSDATSKVREILPNLL